MSWLCGSLDWLLDQSLLAVAGQRVKSTRQSFESVDMRSVNLVLIFCGVAAVALTTAWLYIRIRKWRKERTFNHPGKLFAELCRAHELNRTQRKLLESIAETHRLASPIQIFLRPDLLRASTVADQFPQELVSEVDWILFGDETTC